MRKHSLTISGHATSVTLEDPFWAELKQIAAVQGKPLNALVSEIDAERGSANLSSAIRVYVLACAKKRSKA